MKEEIEWFDVKVEPTRDEQKHGYDLLYLVLERDEKGKVQCVLGRYDGWPQSWHGSLDTEVLYWAHLPKGPVE